MRTTGTARLRTRTVGILATAAIAGVVLAGCGRTDDGGAGTGEAIEIGDAEATGTVTMWAMGAEGEALPDFVAEFEAANPGVSVEVTAIPWDAAHNKFQTAIAGGQTPDIAMMGTTWMPDFADAFATVPSDLDTSGFFEGAVSTSTVDGRQTGIPWYVDTRVLYYRTDMAEQAGWTHAPQTWDELKQMARDMQTAAGAEWGIRLIASGNDSFQGTLWMPWSNGAQLTDGEQWTLDTPEMVEAYEYYQSFFTEGIASADLDNAAGAQENDFVSGAAPMLIEGPFLRGQLAQIGGEDFENQYATAVLPEKESSTSFSGGSNLVVFENSDNAVSAWKLAEWLSQPETQEAWWEITGDLPAVQAAWDAPGLSGDDKLAAFGEQLESAEAPPATTTWVQVSAAGDTMLERISRQQSSPAEALAELQRQADSIGMG